MPLRVSPSIEDVRDLELLIRANHSLIVLETEEPERAEPLVKSGYGSYLLTLLESGR